MKVQNVKIEPIALAVTPIGNRFYKMTYPLTTIDVVTDEGVFCFKIRQGFVTNFRSGGICVDSFIDQVGDEKKALCYLVHDAVYTPCASCGLEHPLSRKKGDEILRAGLLWAGMSKFKANLVYRSVRWFGRSAYEDDDALTSANSKLFRFEWRAK